MVRVRFAPSPTGLLHIGNARIAVFNWLFAKRHKGVFVLRIEDTDVERSERRFITQLIEDLHWLGLTWQEGPDVGGQYGPYMQSERLPIYHDICQKLMGEGLAYRCYCTPEELKKRRLIAAQKGTPPRYDNRCRDLTDAQGKSLEAAGVPFTIRFKVPEGAVTFTDLIRGTCRFDMKLTGDFVIIKSDGTPTFHFAVVVDDALMRITHVIRGEDHLSNTPLHLALFTALKQTPPQFAHVSLTMGEDRSLLSKRHGAFSIQEYRRLGYLPEGLVNYMLLLGWSPGNRKEKFSVHEILDTFDLSDMNKAPSVFDRQKLDWLNGQYIREADLERLTAMAIPYLQEAGFVPRDVNTTDRARVRLMVEAVRDNLRCMSQIVRETEVFFKEPVVNEAQARFLSAEGSQTVLLSFYKEFMQCDIFSDENFKKMLDSVKKQTGVGGKGLYLPLRIALTGREHGPELYRVVLALGIDTSIKRIRRFLIKKPDSL